MTGNGHQLGDFLKGRLAFIEHKCAHGGRPLPEVLRDIEQEAVRLAVTADKRAALQALFARPVLPSATFPDWLDALLLESMARVLAGRAGRLWTRTSREPCVPFEAGQFNARRQAQEVFRIMYMGKTPAQWLERSFPIIYRKCYGDAAAASLRLSHTSDHDWTVAMQNHSLEKAGPLDCSTIIGYLFGALEVLKAAHPVVEHTHCGVIPGAPASECIFRATWEE